jgi:hypothetical protein
MVMAGHTELGPFREPLIDWALGAFKSLTGVAATDVKPKLLAIFDQMDGSFAALSYLREGGQMAMVEIVGAKDGAKAAAASNELIGAIFTSPTITIDMLGARMSFTLRKDLPPVAGVPVTGYRMSVDISKMEPTQAEIFKRSYGDGIDLIMGGVDKTVLLVMAVDAGALMGTLVPAVKSGTGAYTPSPAVKAAVDEAKKRKESVFMFMDMAAMMRQGLPSAGPIQPSQSGMSVTMGFADGAAHMRIGLPVAHVREIMGGFMGGMR